MDRGWGIKTTTNHFQEARFHAQQYSLLHLQAKCRRKCRSDLSPLPLYWRSLLPAQRRTSPVSSNVARHRGSTAATAACAVPVRPAVQRATARFLAPPGNTAATQFLAQQALPAALQRTALPTAPLANTAVMPCRVRRASHAARRPTAHRMAPLGSIAATVFHAPLG